MISSPSEKADIKSRLVLYGIGALILFAGMTVLGIIYDIVKG